MIESAKFICPFDHQDIVRFFDDTDHTLIAASIAADRAWISLRQTEGQTPARVIIAVDPSRLGAGQHLGTVQFTDDAGKGPVLQLSLQIGDRLGVFSYSDEETSGSYHLDGKVDARTIYNRKRRLMSIQRRLGITTVFVTHDQHEAASIAHQL